MHFSTFIIKVKGTFEYIYKKKKKYFKKGEVLYALYSKISRDLAI